MAIRNNVKTSSGLEVDNELIRDTWRPVYRRFFLRKALARAYDSRKAFWLYHQAVSEQECDCNDVVLFWRIQQMMRATANTLRQQIINREARRLEKRVKEVGAQFEIGGTRRFEPGRTESGLSPNSRLHGRVWCFNWTIYRVRHKDLPMVKRYPVTSFLS